MRHGLRMLAGMVVIAALCAASPATAQRAKTLSVSFPSEDGSLTPYTFKTGYPLVMLVYDSLMWRDADGVARPWLASSVRRDTSGLKVIVKLRDGVRWHDGRPLTVDDVVFTYRYIAAHDHPRFTPQLRDVGSVTAPNPRTVVFNLRHVSLGFEDQPLADVPILPRHLWAALPAGQSAPAGLPVGSGPYRLARHVPGESYLFRSNRGYFKGSPSADELRMPIVSSEDDAFARLKRGSLDAAPVNLPAGGRIERSRRFSYAEGVSYSGTMLEFNLARAPFADLAIRQTVARTLRLDAIAGNKSGPGAMPIADRGMLHPQSPWSSRKTLHRSDVAAARLVFTEQAVAPFTILASSSDGVRLEAAKRVAAALQQAGAQVRVEALPARQFERRLGRGESPADFDAAIVGIPALASYDPAYLRNVFGDPRDAALNDGGYRSAHFESLANRVGSAKTRTARRDAVDAQLELLAHDAPAVPLFFGGTTFAYRGLVHAGWVEVKGVGILDKQSFLEAPAQEPGQPAAAASDARDTAGDGEGISLVPAIIGLAALLIVGAMVAARRGRSANSARRPRGR